MRLLIKARQRCICAYLVGTLLVFSQSVMSESAVQKEVEPEKGPHRGRMLSDGDFTLELAIFETGVPPEFRVWMTSKGQPVSPRDVTLQVKLIRLGDQVDHINFKEQADFLRGDMVIYEPHSFIVDIKAEHGASAHTWRYDNFEGRTKIEANVAKALEIKTSIAGPAALQETATVYGRIVHNADRVAAVTARFDGVIKSIQVSVGDMVSAGQVLATIESNESLKSYAVNAPLGGIVTQRNANAGEQTQGRLLFTLADTSVVWANLAIFPKDLARVTKGQSVAITSTTTGTQATGNIALLHMNAQENQSVLARVPIDNTDGKFLPGMHVTAQVKVGEINVPLAVKRSGLQAFRDFTVVYAKVEDEYEVRMLELGRQLGEWAEVVGGLKSGTEYVSSNSYIIKADIEKSGASHDH